MNKNKSTISALILTAILAFNATAANAGIIVAERTSNNTRTTSTVNVSSGGIIVAEIFGIIVAEIAGIIVAESDGIIVAEGEAPRDGIIVAE